MEYLLCLALGFAIGCYAYSKGHRAQSPFYKENK
tara:strand:- start:412 stop:513 length:102 start_codon:yes stop_codon:yes gene_type:complete